jgi:decaprenylphospho-beta-D-ribofuranose 2-oxidase
MSSYSLTPDRIERVDSWGMNLTSLSYVFRPTTYSQILEVFDIAAKNGKTVGLRGAGFSYGDASMNSAGVLLDLSRMNRIIDWNPQSGLITVQPGVTLRQIWQYCIEDGWWPPVVSGTMFVTVGGAAGMNIHGKNNFKAGPIGNHIVKFEMVTPSGETKICSRTANSDLFHAAIGGFGMLGVFTSITLQMKKIYSGLLQVEAFATTSFEDIIEQSRWLDRLFRDRRPAGPRLGASGKLSFTGRRPRSIANVESEKPGAARHPYGHLPEIVDVAPPKAVRQ